MAVAKLIINSIPGDQFYLLATVCYCPFIPAQTQILYLFSATSFCFLVPLVLGESFCHYVRCHDIMSYNVTLSCCAQTPRSRRCSTGSRGRCAGEGRTCHVSRVTCLVSHLVTCHEDCAQDGAGRVQAGQAALRLDQLQGGLHSRGLHLLADRGQYSTVLYSTISNIQVSARWSTISTTRTRAWWPPRPANSSPT